MKTLTEKYNGVLEGTFSKAQFVRDARLLHPNFITQVNGFDDIIQILKNKGMISEVVKEEVSKYKADKSPEYKEERISDDFHLEEIERAIDYELEDKGFDTVSIDFTKEDYRKAREKALKNLIKNRNHYLHILSGDNKKTKRHDEYQEVKKDNHKDVFNGMKKAELREGIKQLVTKILQEGKNN